MTGTGLHDKHRQRLKERYLEYGIEALEPHVALELLLGYSILRKDTNALAHELILRFGSLRAVFDAGVGELTAIRGITKHSAVLLKLCGDFSRFRHKEIAAEGVSFRDPEAAAEFIKPLFLGQEVESVWLFCLSANMRLKSFKKIYEGDVNMARFRIRDITEAAFRAGAPKVVLAHNHPRGSSIPSGADLDTTRRIRDSLASNSIELVEHFVIGREDYTPIMLCAGRDVPGAMC